MIDNHDFNSAWWGKPVGIVRDPAFFNLHESERLSLLQAYDWVEYIGTGDLEGRMRAPAICSAGFCHVDAQLRFRIKLVTNNLFSQECASMIAGDENVFRLEPENFAEFEFERFKILPGCEGAKLNERYALWAKDLYTRNSKLCMQLNLDETTQGWFFSSPGSGRIVNLDLAVMAKDAKISGLALYERALAYYADLGFRVGQAGFSAHNFRVMNIYASLGAKFLDSRDCWVWCKNTSIG